MAQTPQGFRYDILKKAFDDAAADGFIGTDEASLIERSGLPVAVVMGSPRNIKITTPCGYGTRGVLFEELTAGRTKRLLTAGSSTTDEDEQMAGHSNTQSMPPQFRIGQGYDSHEFKAGIPLVIGGVKLEHDKGLGGHSDGDVLLHAITWMLCWARLPGPTSEALFPPTDSAVERRGLSRVSARGAEAGCGRGLCAGQSGFDADFERSKNRYRHAAAIRARVAELCGIPNDCVGIKAKDARRHGHGQCRDRACVVLLRT